MKTPWYERLADYGDRHPRLAVYTAMAIMCAAITALLLPVYLSR